jgi:hypothetical protein
MMALFRLFEKSPMAFLARTRICLPNRALTVHGPSLAKASGTDAKTLAELDSFHAAYHLIPECAHFTGSLPVVHRPKCSPGLRSPWPTPAAVEARSRFWPARCTRPAGSLHLLMGGRPPRALWLRRWS